LNAQQGCGKFTHVIGTNGGKMPCGALLTMGGETVPYYCYECDVKHARAKQAIGQWYTMRSESENRESVGKIPGALQYGALVSWHKLPAQARAIIETAYHAQMDGAQ
jgi:hypothetical protein